MHRTMIIGAGASTPFYDPPLQTKTITDHLTSISRWDDIITRYQHTPAATTNTVSPEDVIPTMLRAMSINHRMNFEDLIDLLDKISSYNLTKHYTFSHRYSLHDLLAYYNAIPADDSTDWSIVPYLARLLITECIANTPRNHAQQHLINEQQAFIARLLETGDTLSIYTLNYDEPLLRSTTSLPTVETGFLTGGQFHPPAFFRATNILAFPHGTARFSWENKDGIRYHPTPGDAENARWAAFDIRQHHQGATMVDHHFAPHFDTFITTGRTKEHALDTLPYGAYYQRLATDLQRTDELVIIGYSFQDPHINRFLNTFLPHPHRRVLLIDKDDKPIDPRRAWKNDPQEYSARASTCLGYPTYDWNPNPSQLLDVANQREIDQLNNDGYGVLAQSIVLDKRGYDTFLNDRQPVLDILTNVRTTP